MDEGELMSTPITYEWKGEAVPGALDAVQGFVEERLEAAGASMKTRMQMSLAVEEVFVNIARYAYAPGTGEVSVTVTFTGPPSAAEVTFRDRGIPYDPLSNRDPDVTLPAEERQIGGLGVFMMKKLTDEMHYAYRDGENVLTLKKLP